MAASGKIPCLDKSSPTEVDMHTKVDMIKLVPKDSEMNLMQKMQNCIQELEQFASCRSIFDKMQSPMLLERFHSVLGSQEKMQMVIYVTGSIEFDLFNFTIFHISLAILMKRRFIWIGEIEVFGPALSLADSNVLTSLGCSVISINEEQFRRKAIKPTMFFMPCCQAEMYDSILEANWGVNQLKNIVVFGSSFEWKLTFGVLCKHIVSADRFMNEFRVGGFNLNHSCEYHYSISFQSWHFFSPVSEADVVLQPLHEILQWLPFDFGTNFVSEHELLQMVQNSYEKFLNTEFFHSFFDQMHTTEMLERFRKVLGSEMKMHIVIYGIGSIESSEYSRFQLVLALLMKVKFNWIGEIEVFDPMISSTESKVLTSLGCWVLYVNERCRREVVEPTMFIMLDCQEQFYDNLLEANWEVDQLENLLLLSNNFESYTNKPSRIEVASSFTERFDIKTPLSEDDTPFSSLSWHFFNPVSDHE